VDAEVKGDSMRSLKDNLHAILDLNIILLVGLSFTALVVLSYVIFILRDEIFDMRTYGTTNDANATAASINSSVNNITVGFDSAVGLILVAITVFILAIAIGALLMLRGRR